MGVSWQEKVTKDLFKEYNYSVSKLGFNSFLAWNSSFCVVYSPYIQGNLVLVAGASFLVQDKKYLLQKYKNADNAGIKVFEDIMNNRVGVQHYGSIFNHDIALFELKSALARMS